MAAVASEKQHTEIWVPIRGMIFYFLLINNANISPNSLGLQPGLHEKNQVLWKKIKKYDFLQSKL